MSVETDSASVSDPSESLTHDFLIKRPQADIDPVEKVLKLRDFIEDIPKSRATFRGGDVFMPSVASHIGSDIYNFLGSWELPDYYLTGETATGGLQWVNPNYYHRRQYSDVAVRCKCGAILIREENVQGESVVEGEHEHTDDCLKQWRLRARARLSERRAEIINHMTSMGHERIDTGKRMGITGNAVSTIAKRVGADIENSEKRYFDCRNRTIPKLLESHSSEDVGRVYGMSDRRVKEVYREETGGSTRGLPYG